MAATFLPLSALALDRAAMVPEGRVIGHRGLGAHHVPEPENSAWALAAAFQAGVSAVEFDVQLTTDDELILAHDVTLDRMTTGSGCVSERDLTYLSRLQLRDGKGHPTEKSVSTFDEALDIVRAYDVPGTRPFVADIHIKVYDHFHGDWGGLVNHFCSPTRYRKLTRMVLEAVRKHGLSDRVIFTAFDERVLKLIRKLEPKARVGLLSDFRQVNAIKRALKAKYDAVGLEFDRINAKETKLAHDHGLAVYAWSPAAEADMEKLFATYQVDSVIADDVPNALQACRKSCYTLAHE
ncbi:MAG: hypothetical protein HY075_13980 [Deltaproteobacteria bacterium]|nr:hypothetical protein [Deltaproteobacteria bacterium]